MATSGKKGKTKWKPVESSKIFNSTTTRKTIGNWADDSNDPDDAYEYSGRKTEVTLPTAPRASRDSENDARIPQEPPFEAYLSNLSYEVTEEDLADFFSKLRVKSVRLPRDDRNNDRAKGFGYIEFEDRNSLIEALNTPDTNLKNRRMRIEVAEGDQGRGGRGGPRDRVSYEPDRTMNDWRSGPRTESDPYSSDGYRSGPRREYGSDRGGGGGMYGDRDRRGYRDDDRGYKRDDRTSFKENRSFRDDRGYDRGGDRYERRGFDDRRDIRRDFSGGGERSWRRDNEPRPDREPMIREGDKGEPKTRTKLNLQPRTRPVDERVNGDGNISSSNAPSTPSASIFGNAKPVDTASRERLIEERLAKSAAFSREDIKPTAQSTLRDTPSTKEDGPSTPSLEPAPPPKENVWTKRSQPAPSQADLLPHLFVAEEGQQEEEGDNK